MKVSVSSVCASASRRAQHCRTAHECKREREPWRKALILAAWRAIPMGQTSEIARLRPPVERGGVGRKVDPFCCGFFSFRDCYKIS